MLSAARLDGAQALVDRNGWLHALQPAGPVPMESLHQLAIAPLPRSSIFAMPHHH